MGEDHQDDVRQAARQQQHDIFFQRLLCAVLKAKIHIFTSNDADLIYPLKP